MSFQPPISPENYQTQLLAGSTLTDPNAILVGAPVQDAFGYFTLTIAGGLATPLPQNGAALLWPFIGPEGATRQWGKPWNAILRIEIDTAALPSLVSDLWVAVLIGNNVVTLAGSNFNAGGLAFTLGSIKNYGSNPTANIVSGVGDPTSTGASTAFSLFPGAVQGNTKMTDVMVAQFKAGAGAVAGGRSIAVSTQEITPGPVAFGLVAGRLLATAGNATVRARALYSVTRQVTTASGWTP